MNNKTRKYKIYAHINSINGKVYIGQTCYKYVSERWRNGNGYKQCPHFYNAIKKYGWDNFKHIILFDNVNGFEMADTIESELIKKYQSNNNKYGYNLTTGGSFGKTLSEETKEKIRITKLGSKNPNYHKKASKVTLERLSKSHKGMKQSEEWINKRKLYGKNNPMYGRKMDDLHKERLLQINTGRKPTEETRKKLRQSKLGNKNPMWHKKIQESTRELISKNNTGENNPMACICIMFSKSKNFERKYLCAKDILKDFSNIKYGYLMKKYVNGNELLDNEYMIIKENRFLDWCNKNEIKFDMTDIQQRYDAYNKYFYEMRWKEENAKHQDE